MPAALAALMTERSLVPNTPSAFAALEQRVEVGHRLHHLNAVLLGLQALVDLDEGHDAAVDQRLRRRLAVDLPSIVRSNRIAPITLPRAEAGRGDDPRAHLVDEVEHLLVAGPRALLDAVALQRLGRGPARLVERGDEAVRPARSSRSFQTGSCSPLLLFERGDARKRTPFHPFEKRSARGRDEGEVLARRRRG